MLRKSVIKDVALLFFFAITLWLVNMYIRALKNNKKSIKELQKINNICIVLADWFEIKKENISFDKWLLHKGINKIAIYGFGLLGKCLYHELKHSKVEIACIADRNANNISSEIGCVLPTEICEVDAIVITAIDSYDEIESDLMKMYDTEILSIEDVIYGLGIVK